MSVSVATAGSSLGQLLSDPRDRRVVRYALGSTLAMAVAMGFDWELAFLVPVLSLSFLASPATHPTPRKGLAFVMVIGVACVAGLMLGQYLIPYPLVYVPFTSLVLFHIFYAQTGGTSPLLTTWLIIALLVIPMMRLQASGLGTFVASGIVVDAAVTIALILLVYRLIPEPTGASTAGKAAAPPTPHERVRSAAIRTLVVAPAMVVFYAFNWTNSLLILIFIALLSQQPAFAKDFKAGSALILGNVIGGLAAITMYELLVMVPMFGYLVLLTLLAGLVFGARVFSGTPKAPLYGMAFSTLLLVIGSQTSSSGDAGGKVYSRVIQIMIAVVYLVVAFGLIERLTRRREG